MNNYIHSYCGNSADNLLANKLYNNNIYINIIFMPYLLCDIHYPPTIPKYI